MNLDKLENALIEAFNAADDSIPLEIRDRIRDLMHEVMYYRDSLR